VNYCSPLYFLLFFPPVVLGYQLMPKRWRWTVLLAASYVFFWTISRKLLIYLLLSTFSIHHFGLWMDTIQRERDTAVKGVERSARKELKAAYGKKQLHVIAFAVVLHVGLLLVLKYSSFFGRNFNALLSALQCPISVPVPTFLVPIGISFYTLQAVSYLFDVYRGVIPADRNLGRLALYMSFFPGLMEGPIARYSDTAKQLWEGEGIHYHNLTFGIQRMLYGYLKKFVVADRLDLLVKTVFLDYAQLDGGMVALGMICYTCQLYMEFSGTMDVVLGSAEIFGIHLPENFRQPFFSKSISDFWTRWHITLGTWFKDYIFYPVSLSKPMKKLTSNARKKLGNHFGPLCASSIALFCVWFCNGLWHGAAWSYLFFGMYHFVLILLGNITEPYSRQLLERLHIQRNGAAWSVVRIVRTVLLVNIGELFFRAHGLAAGLSMFRIMVSKFTLTSFADGTFLTLGLDAYDFLIVLVTVVIVLGVSLLHEQGISIRETVAEQKTGVRWALYYALILAIVVFGAYGIGYVPVDPIYAGF
jgi:D-alanyl-lipoteichoic acid acyltransferase DltB (MBOAT superfamily)